MIDPIQFEQLKNDLHNFFYYESVEGQKIKELEAKIKELDTIIEVHRTKIRRRIVLLRDVVYGMGG